MSGAVEITVWSPDSGDCFLVGSGRWFAVGDVGFVLWQW